MNTINEIRRSFTHWLTKSMGSTPHDVEVNPQDRYKIKRILLSRPNHRLGNQLLITPLLEEIEEVFPNCQVDCFVKGGLGTVLFQNYSNVSSTIALPKKPFKELGKYLSVWAAIKQKKYDIAISLSEISSSGKLSIRFSSAKYKIYGDTLEELKEQYPDYMHIAKKPVYNFRNFLLKLGIDRTKKPVPELDLKLQESELVHGRELLQQVAGTTDKVIALFTYATGAKKYKKKWWEKFYKKLKADFPDYAIIEVLPVENTSQLQFKLPTFYSKDIRDIAAFIANTSVFIAADSGMMHLAVASHAPVVGLFSVTKPEIYQPYGDKNKAIDTRISKKRDILAAVHTILD